jgi:hypothetical protein
VTRGLRAALALIAPAKATAIIAICIFLIVTFLLLTLAESDFWLDVQATNPSVMRLV